MELLKIMRPCWNGPHYMKSEPGRVVMRAIFLSFQKSVPGTK